jgi:pimeloyl-ACP methyl ester carboxylesterase
MTHTNPGGMMRRGTVSSVAPFARHFTVFVVNRRHGMPAGASMSDIAADYAEVIEKHLDGQALVHGTSTGGSVALQLAVDHPTLVRRLVLASAACRLGPVGRLGQAELARLIRAGDLRHAFGPLAESAVPPLLRYPARGVAWAFGPRMAPDDPADLLITLDAEDAFDVEADLARVQAPTLVLGGSADPFYPPELFRRTADGVRNGHALIFQGKGHVYAASSSAATHAALGFLLGD